MILSVVSLSGLHAETTGEAYQRLSRKISYLTYEDVLWQRTPGCFEDDPDLKVSWEHYQQAMSVKTDLAELRTLAGHPDPKVRTLAMMRLYDMEEPEAFRVIHARVGDPAETFPSRSLLTERPDRTFELTSKPSTVAEVAKMILEQAALPTLWLADPTNRRTIEEWTGWYEYLYRRATGRTSPIPLDRVPKMAAVRRKIEALPPLTRAWMLLAVGTTDLHINEGRDPKTHIPLFATEEELVAAAKQLGPDALLTFLRDGTRGGLRDPKGDDALKGRGFVISRAKHIFRKQDAEALKSMHLLVAAADANPEMASQWIREELELREQSGSGYGPGTAIAALVDLCGDRESDFVVNWFHGDHGKYQGNNAESDFIRELKRRRPAEWRKTLRGVVGHPAFERLDKYSVFYLGELVRTLEAAEIVNWSSSGSSPAATVRNTLRQHFGLPLMSYRALEDKIESVLQPVLTAKLPVAADFIELSPDGSIVAVVPFKEHVRLFSTADGKSLGTLATEGWVRAVHFGRSDGRLMTLNREQLLQTWDLATAKEISRTRSEALTISFDAIFSSDGGFLVTSDQGYAVIDLGSGKPRWKIAMTTVGSGMFRLSPDDQRLAVNDGHEKKIRFFDIATSKPFATLDGHAEVPVGAAFSPDGKVFVSWANEARIMFWDGKTGAFQHEFTHPQGLRPWLIFTADSRHHLCSTEQRQLALFDVKTGIATRAFAHSPEIAGKGHHGPYALRISTDGKKLIGLTGLNTGKQDQIETYLECWEISEEP